MTEASADATAATRGREQRFRRGLPSVVTGDRVFAVGLFTVGVIAVVLGLGYGVIRPDGIIGPGFMPVVFGVILLGCTAMVLVRSLRTSSAQTPPTELGSLAEQSMLEAEDDVAPIERPGSERSALLVAIGIGVALWLAGWIGLIPALTVLVFAILRWIEKESWVKSILIALVLGVAAWFVFTRLLQVPLDFGFISLYLHI